MAMKNIDPIHYRKHVRLKLTYTQYALMNIIRVNEEFLNTKHKPVLLCDISPGGLQVLTDLKLPVINDILLGFKIVLFGLTLFLPGSIVWRKPDGNMYRYGIKLVLYESLRRQIIKILNKVLLQQSPENRKVHEIYRLFSQKYRDEDRSQVDYRT